MRYSGVPAIREIPVANEEAGPYGIVTGPDGALWFTLNQANAIGRITTGGDIVLHPLPTPDAAPVGITGDGAALWFVEIAAGQVGRISMDGRIEEFPLPDRTARPHAIVAASAGDCWFTEWGAAVLVTSPRAARSPNTTCRHRHPDLTASPWVLTALSGRPLRREGSREWHRSPRYGRPLRGRPARAGPRARRGPAVALPDPIL